MSANFIINLGQKSFEVEAKPTNGWLMEVDQGKWINIVETVTTEGSLGGDYMIMLDWPADYKIQNQVLNDGFNLEPKQFEVMIYEPNENKSIKGEEVLIKGLALAQRCWIFESPFDGEETDDSYHQYLDEEEEYFTEGINDDNWIRIIEREGQYFILSYWNKNRYKIQGEIKEYHIHNDESKDLIRVDEKNKVAYFHLAHDEEDEDNEETLKRVHIDEHGALFIYNKNPAIEIKFIQVIPSIVDSSFFSDYWTPTNIGAAVLFLDNETDLTYILISGINFLKFNALALIVNFYIYFKYDYDEVKTIPYAIDEERNLYFEDDNNIIVFKPEIYLEYESAPKFIEKWLKNELEESVKNEKMILDTQFLL